MRRLAWLLLPLALCGCGGSKSPTSLAVICGGRTALAGASTIEVSGDTTDGRPTLSFPDPANPGSIGTIVVPARDRCRIVPSDTLVK